MAQRIYPRLVLKGIRYPPPSVIIPLPTRTCWICNTSMILFDEENLWKCPRCGNTEGQINI